MGDTVPSGKWPCPKEAENVKLGTISNIMQAFNITAEAFLDHQSEYLERYRELKESGW